MLERKAKRIGSGTAFSDLDRGTDRMSHANVTTRAAELAELLLEEVSEADQNWHTIEWCARELVELAAQVLQGATDSERSSSDR